MHLIANLGTLENLTSKTLLVLCMCVWGGGGGPVGTVGRIGEIWKKLDYFFIASDLTFLSFKLFYFMALMKKSTEHYH